MIIELIVIIINKITGLPLFTLLHSNEPTFYLLIIFHFHFQFLRTWIFPQAETTRKNAVLLLKVFFVFFSFFSLLVIFCRVLHIFESNRMNTNFIHFCHVSEWHGKHWHSTLLWKITSRDVAVFFLLFLTVSHFFTFIFRRLAMAVLRDKQL